MREIAGLMAPTLFGVAIYQINTYVSGLVAFSVERSAASLLFFANRLMELPIGVFAIAVSTVIYPLLAKHAVERKFVEMANDYRKGLRLILIINVPAAAGLTLLAEPIVRTLFQHGQFTAESTQAMAPLLGWLAIGMPFFSVVGLTTRAFYAVKDTRTPVKFAALSFAINLGLIAGLLEWLGDGEFGARHLALASTVAVVVQTLGLQWALTLRLPAMQFGDLWRTLGKVLLASALMSGGVYGGWVWLQASVPGRGADIAALVGLIPAAVTVYGLALWALRIEGREELAALLGKLKGKLKRK